MCSNSTRKLPLLYFYQQALTFWVLRETNAAVFWFRINCAEKYSELIHTNALATLKKKKKSQPAILQGQKSVPDHQWAFILTGAKQCFQQYPVPHTENNDWLLLESFCLLWISSCIIKFKKEKILFSFACLVLSFLFFHLLVVFFLKMYLFSKGVKEN